MRLHHVLLSCLDIARSREFYTQFLSFEKSGPWSAADGREAEVLSRKNPDLSLLLTSSVSEEKLGPQHIALEVGPAEFKRLFSQAQKMGLEPRAELRADAPADAGVLHMSGKAYRHFYVLDPSRVSVEILTPLSLGI